MNSINVSINQLFFDPNNYRLHNNLRYEKIDDSQITSVAIQKRTQDLIAGGKKRKNADVKDLINSFKSNGYLRVDNILVRQLDENSYLIVEGNRRLATLRILYEEYKNEFDIGKLDAAIFESPRDNFDRTKGIEVIVVNDELEGGFYNILMGLKHVKGIKKWHTFNQSKLLYTLYSQHNYSYSEIADKLGFETQTPVASQIKAYCAMVHFIEYIKENSIEYENYNPYDKFMIFLTLIGKPKLREWLEWEEKAFSFQNKTNLRRFYSWITPREILDEENDNPEEVKYILHPPYIDNHKEIRELADKIEDEAFLEQMEERGSFETALKNDITHNKKLFSQKLMHIKNAINDINFKNVENMTKKDDRTLEEIKKLIDQIKSHRNNIHA
jgi:hypothetical protein